MSENKQQVYSKAEFVTRVSEALTSFLETNAEGVEDYALELEALFERLKALED